MNMEHASGKLIVRIEEGVIAEDAASHLADARSGAVASFRGVVRAHDGGRDVAAIEYECYREMAEKEMTGVLQDAMSRHDLHAALIIHRNGKVPAGETSVLVAVAAAHRRPAFDAVREIVDALKTRVPIWKKEHYRDGSSDWLLPR